MTLSLAVVDLAGTTVAENGLVERSLRTAVERVGATLPPDFGAWFRSVRGAAKRDLCLTLTDGDQARADRAVAAFDAEMVTAVRRGEVTPLPGAEDALRRLRGLGLKVALTTGFSASLRQHLLDTLGWVSLADLALSPEDVGRGRPYPDLVLTAVLRLQVTSVREVATVGDTVNDLVAGHRSGAGVVAGVLTGAHDRAELEAAPHTHVVADIGSFVDVLTAIHRF